MILVVGVELEEGWGGGKGDFGAGKRKKIVGNEKSVYLCSLITDQQFLINNLKTTSYASKN